MKSERSKLKRISTAVICVLLLMMSLPVTAHEVSAVESGFTHSPERMNEAVSIDRVVKMIDANERNKK